MVYYYWVGNSKIFLKNYKNYIGSIQEENIMLMTQNFKSMVQQGGNLQLTRTGEAEALVIAQELLKRTTFDANIEGKNIVLTEGESTYILADKFGVATGSDEAEVNLFFVDGGMVIELLDGEVVLLDGNGDPYLVDQDGEISYPSAKSRVRMMDASEMREKAEMIIGRRYTLQSKEDETAYVNNLLLNMVINYSTSSTVEPCLSVRVTDVYEDLGLEQFVFVNYTDHKNFIDDKNDKDDFVDSSDLGKDELFEEEEEEKDEFDMTHEDDED